MAKYYMLQTALNFACPNGQGLCASMGLPDGLNSTGPGVSNVPVGWVDTKCGSTCFADGTCARSYTYFPQSWDNQTVASVYPGYVNVFGLRQYDGQCAFFGNGKPPLPEGLGWFILIGIGGFFSVLTSGLVWIGSRYTGQAEQTSEEYSTAGRSIKTGLTATDIVSKWTWAATLLQSSNVAFKFGVAGPFWYAAGATIQVLLFAVIAVEIKRKCPSLHTALEIVDARWGTTAHKVFMFWMLMSNVIVTAMLILGGAAVVTALSGVDIFAASFIIPISVVVYTAHGGLRATFVASWAHTAIVYVALCIFMFEVYATNPMLGSPSAVWKNLRVISVTMPVENNKPLGSYLTMRSQSGLMFGIINIIGNFGTVFVDQAYWQSAIAAKPSATYRGYLLGGLCWFSIPFTLATTMGLSARAFDLPVSVAESNKGLVPPAVASHLLGTGGAFLILLQVFMAVTSSGSAEQIAVSSIFAYDIYRKYMNPKATGKQMVLVSRVGVVAFGIISGLMAVALQQLGLNLGWVYDAMGIFIGGAVFPLAFSLTWTKVSSKNAITSVVLSTCAGIIAWMVQTRRDNPGKPITYESLGDLVCNLAGGVTSLCSSLFICVPWALIAPDNYDFADLYRKTEALQIEYDGTAELATSGEESAEAMDKALKWTYWTGGFLTLTLIILWPALTVPVQGPNGTGDMSESYWGWWVTLAIIWGLLATAVCTLLPIWEARDVFYALFRNILFGDPIVKAEPEHHKVPRPEPEAAQ